MRHIPIGRSIVIAKGADRSYSYHSIQLNLDACLSEKDYTFFRLQQQIPADAIYRELPQVKSTFGALVDDPNEEFGLESKPHITVLYGLTDENTFFPIRKALVANGAIKFQFGKIGSFRTADDHDVIIVEIISPDLHKVNGILRQFPYENTYPEYKPHMTVSYVKKGACKDLEGDWDGMGRTMTANALDWSHKDKFHLDLPLKGS